MTVANVPVVKSAGSDVARLWRSIDFGVNTTSGRCCGSSACRRSRWKYEAGVDGCATVMSLLAARLQEALDACRGVVGALALVPVRQQQHDARLLAPLLLAGEMNSSTIVCAPLTKSPNCASHSTSASGRATE